jgi:lipoprotein-releasing system permease protein
MSFEWFVARRYLTARRKQAFISLISGVSIVGVGVGVMALVIALAIMTGVQSELRSRILGSTAHVYVSKIGGGGFTDVAAEVRRVSSAQVAAASPIVLGKGLVHSARGESQGMMIKGIDPVREPAVTEIVAAMKTGSYDDLVHRPPDGFPGLLLGADLADALGVSRGDRVTVLTGETRTSAMGGTAWNHADFDVVGTFQFGFYEFDSTTGLMLIDDATDLLNKSGPDMLQLRLVDMDEAPAVSRILHDQLGPGYRVQNWSELNRSLYAALALEKLAISLTIGLIVMVAALNIVASLVLLVMEKSRDIAILRTMGAPAGAIRRIFVFQGLIIGGVGTLAGAALGLVVCSIADRYRLIKLPGDVYQISYLPFRVQPADVLVVVIAALGVCLLATLYPSRQAGRLDPAEALRNQ